MKKSAYLFFGVVLFLLFLPFLTGWVYPEIQHILHTQEEQIEQITSLVEEHRPNAEIDRIHYSHHARLYYIYLSDGNYLCFDENFELYP